MAKNCHNDYKMKFSADEEFPDLSQHNNHMAKVQQLERNSSVASEWNDRFSEHTSLSYNTSKKIKKVA